MLPYMYVVNDINDECLQAPEVCLSIEKTNLLSTMRSNAI